jgi:hypothetical protein
MAADLVNFYQLIVNFSQRISVCPRMPNGLPPSLPAAAAEWTTNSLSKVSAGRRRRIRAFEMCARKSAEGKKRKRSTISRNEEQSFESDVLNEIQVCISTPNVAYSSAASSRYVW